MYYTSPGRPPIFKNRKTIIAYVEESVYNEIKDIARRKGVSVSEVVRGILESYLKRKGKLKGKEKEKERVDPIAIKRRQVILRAEFQQLMEEYRKALAIVIEDDYGRRPKSLDELIKLAETPNGLTRKHRIPKGPNNYDIKTTYEILSERRDLLLKLLKAIEEKEVEAQKIGYKELINRCKKASNEITETLARLLTVLDKFPK